MERNTVYERGYACRDLVYVNTLDDAVGQKGCNPKSLLVKWHVNFEVVDAQGKPLPGVRVALDGGGTEYDGGRITDEQGRCTIDAVDFYREGDQDIKPVYEIRATHGGQTTVLAPEWQCGGNAWFRYQVGKAAEVVKEEASPYQLQEKTLLRKKSDKSAPSAQVLLLDTFDTGGPCGWKLGRWGGVRNVSMDCRARPGFRSPFCLRAKDIVLDPELNEEKGRVELTRDLVREPGVEGAEDLNVIYRDGMKLKLAYFVEGASRPSWLSLRVWAEGPAGPVGVFDRLVPGMQMKRTGVMTAGKWQEVEFPLARCTGRDAKTKEVFCLEEGSKLTRFCLSFAWKWRGDYSSGNPPDVSAVRLDNVQIVCEGKKRTAVVCGGGPWRPRAAQETHERKASAGVALARVAWPAMRTMPSGGPIWMARTSRT